MLSMLCSLWDDFRKWVTVDWSQLTFILVICAFGILGTMALLTFFKKSKGDGKKPIKWSSLVLCILMYGLLALVAFAKI